MAWATDHITKTTTYTFADRTTNPVVSTVQPTSAVTWAADHITKTTTLTYGDGKSTSSTATVPGTVGTPTYAAGVETKVTTYGDGTTATATSAATKTVVAWAADHITKTTTYTFSDATTNPVVTTVQPTASQPILTAAIYSGNWTSSGSITLPSTSAKKYIFGDGSSAIVEDGSLTKPFNQATLTPTGPSGIAAINDPNSIVNSPTNISYNLIWGTPDNMGPTYANMFASGSYTFPSYFTMMGHIISGQCSSGQIYHGCSNGATLVQPLPDVIEAFNAGWTGKGVNVLMVDGYSSSIGAGVYGGDAHGLTTMVIVGRYAMGANLYGLDYTLNKNTGYPIGLVRNFSGSVATPTKMDVINLSYGANYWSIVGHSGAAITQADINYVVSQTINNASAINYLLDGTFSTGGFTINNAVIVKSAGNDNTNSFIEPYVGLFASNTKISPRLLIVGALNQSGSKNNPATIANYSNFAGTNLIIQNRFLVASGMVPFNNGAVAVDGVPINATGNEGTSYAAPRVAGYAAIVRQKFPNLSGANTADILLSTARYDTLTCYPNCDKAIYGQGEATLSRALAPVGYLR